MSSPFPGMDPYLEDSEFWRGFHNMMITFIARQMNTDLPRGYAANVEEHVLIEPDHAELYPDIFITERSPQSFRTRTGGAALLEAREAAAPVEVYTNEPRQRYLKVVTGSHWQEVVAIVEILSPANKKVGFSHTNYIEKQQKIIHSETHLMEIDFLRTGSHTVAAPYESQRIDFKYPYLISLSRNGRRIPLNVWPITLREPLPRVALPLKPGDPDFILDLQEAFERAYESGPYARSIDYALPPAIPLEGADAEWADAMLREKGLRRLASATDAAHT